MKIDDEDSRKVQRTNKRTIQKKYSVETELVKSNPDRCSIHFLQEYGSRSRKLEYASGEGR